jgi:integration host factor subunit beta
MTRSELVAVLASRFPQLLQKDAGETVSEILGAISRTLSAGHRVEIRGFGSFSLNYQAPRLRRNPKTGETFSTQGKSVPHFKAGKELREAVDFPANQQAALKKAA